MTTENDSNPCRNEAFERIPPGGSMRLSGFPPDHAEGLFIQWARDFPEYGSRCFQFSHVKNGSTYITIALRTDGVDDAVLRNKSEEVGRKIADLSCVSEIVIDTAGYEPLPIRTALRNSKLGWEVEVGGSFSCNMYPYYLKYNGMSFLRKRGWDRAYKAVRDRNFDRRTPKGGLVPGWVVTRIR